MDLTEHNMTKPMARPVRPNTTMNLVGVTAYGAELAVMLSKVLMAHGHIHEEPIDLAGLLAAGDATISTLDVEKVLSNKPKLSEIAQVVVFASGGVTHSVAIRGLPTGDAPCIVVDYDDRHDDSGDMSPADFERKKLGCTREEFDKQATYIW